MPDTSSDITQAQGAGGRGLPHCLTAVLFDLDDTLVDTLDARVSALQGTFTGAGIGNANAEEFFRDIGGRQLLEALSELEQRMGTNHGLLERYRSAYWGKGPRLIRLYPGVVGMLRALQRLGTKLGIVTQKHGLFEIEGRWAGASVELEELGIAAFFSVIVGFEDVANYKPHPEGVAFAMARLGTGPQETLMVGDSAADIEAARAAGCWSCHATWGLSAAGHAVGDVGADMVAETPEALLTLSFA